MSYTSIYELFTTKVNCVAELSNGYGSGPAIWDYISQKLYGKKFDMMNADGFWPSFKDSRLDDNEKAVLLSTYDNSFIEIAQLMDFAKACKDVHRRIIITTDWTWSHFESIGNAAEELHKNHDHRCKGLAIGCTSVSDPWEQEDIKEIKVWGVYEKVKSID